MKNLIFVLLAHTSAPNRRLTQRVFTVRRAHPAALRQTIALAILALCASIPLTTAQQPATQSSPLPPRVLEAQRFLAQRGWTPGHRPPARVTRPRPSIIHPETNAPNAGASATWQPLGPTAVQTPAFGLVTGRVAALALDPSDPTGNRLYVGATGGGVWVAQNAATSNPSSITFTPLTDTLAALGGALDASISIGALTVQPGGTGVILAGTGDPNDVLDSYYGAGILRSTDGGNSWTLISKTVDLEQHLSEKDYSFVGEGFAGFAWSTVNPQLVVAAVSQAFEGTLVNAVRSESSFQGMYYSSDGGATWHLATITDGAGHNVQGPLVQFAEPDGNAATSVVWNPVRQVFIAAVRYHGYYQSLDGITWTRMATQPGPTLRALVCPNNVGGIGSIACPIYRASLAVDPSSGDTFAWTVDANNQDQGLWQDQCNLSGSACSSPTLTFAKQWSTAALQSNTVQGGATIAQGGYNLALAAVPAGPGAGQDTQLFAGANDLWKCSLAMGCVWRNTTNAATCHTAQVGPFQHALAWNPANPLEIFVGNDSGLWRSTDAIAETGPVCSATDSTHFQNLNGGLGSLAEVVSVSTAASSSYKMLAGLGVNGAAGVKGTAAVANWPQVLGGNGGPVAIDFGNEENWFINNQPGVAIYKCAQAADCTSADFGATPVVSDADVGGDGLIMPQPAPFLVDPLDSAQVLVGTCRVWRGPADGSGWTSANRISPILDARPNGTACSGDGLISVLTAIALPGGGERVYLGMHGWANGGANLAGHVLSAIVNPASSTPPVWQDLTLSPVLNDSNAMNRFGMEVSSIFIDPHDATGNTIYVTIAGFETAAEEVRVVYRTTDGGAHWNSLASNLSSTPANSIAVDPDNANTVYLATDQGVFFTTQVGSCALSSCWSAFGTGLPAAPVVALNVSHSGNSASVLIAATYGRGIWQTPLFTAGTTVTAAAVNPSSLSFADQTFGTTSAAQSTTLTNTGSNPLAVTAISMSADFTETDNCVYQSVAPAASCSIQVSFRPNGTGTRTGTMTIAANVYGGQLTVDLSGVGTPAGIVNLNPSSIDFGAIVVGATSVSYQIQASNNGSTDVPISSVAITPPFLIDSNQCGTTTLAAGSSCQLLVRFAPAQAGAIAGILTFVDGAGTQTVTLTGTGVAPPTDTLSPPSLGFSSTAVGALSLAQSVTLINSGDAPLTAISISISGPFQTSNNCAGQLAGKSACTINVVFAPTQLGTQSGTLTVTDALRAQTVALTGLGAAPPALGVNPPSLSFSAQQPGVPSAPQTVTVSNTGGAPMANVGFQVTGPAAASYSVGASTCGAVLNGGASCTAQVVFTPAATGVIAASLTVSSSTQGVNPVSVSLNGSGLLSSGLGSNPAQLTFAAVGVGQSSAGQPVTIVNGSSYAIGSLALTVTGPFSLSQNTCTGSLAAGANCTAAVVFQPTASGPLTGSLTVSSTSVTAPASVALSGVGFDFSLAISGSASITVAAGQTASYTMKITPDKGAPGTFAYTCGALPANAQCVFSPPTTTVGTGIQGTVTVGITTGKSGSARLESPADWRMLPLLCGLLLLPFALRRRRNFFLFALLLAVFVAGISSCTSSGGGTGGGGGSGGGSGGASATPPGTYTVPINVTSTGVSHSVNVTMTVD